VTLPSDVDSTRRRLLSRPDWADWRFVASALRTETIGGVLLLGAAALALVWANSRWSEAYQAVISWVPFEGAPLAAGPLGFHLDLTLSQWAADGLLAIFFFVVALELKRELIAGSLRRPSLAALPAAAAIGGMAVPAITYAAVVGPIGTVDDLRGWGIPVATDIAFALAVLAVLSTHLPSALRLFLLTLAVVDDLLAILIIAFFYTESVDPRYALLALVPIAAFGLLVRARVLAWYLLVPLAVLAWLLVHESGVHATIAGVALGFAVPVARPGSDQRCLASRLEHIWRPVSAGVAVPIFAFTASGVSLVGGGLAEIVADPIALGVIAGLVVGKPVGVMTASFLVARFTHATLDPAIRWRDLFGLSLLTGIGFTVSLLVAELAFRDDPDRVDHASGGVVLGSVVAALLAATVLIGRNRHYRRVEAEEDAARSTGARDP
jgi:NhaA family Na+:H+ antiporter